MKDPAFLFYSKDFYEGTRLMLPEERACYIDLMIYQHQNGFIPNDFKRVIMYCSGVDQATLQATLQAKFKQCSEGWYNERLNIAISQREKYAQKQSLSGKIGQFWKKAKAMLPAREYDELRKVLDNYSSSDIYEYISKYDSINEATLIGLLKHLGNAIVNENIIKDIEKEEKEGTGEKEEKGKDWRTDFEVYKSDLREAFMALAYDQHFVGQQQKFLPNVDIPLTLEKACTNYWATEAGWKHKRRQQAATIDWRTTLTNSLSQPQNKVYKNGTTTTSTSQQEDRKRGERSRMAGLAAAILSESARKTN